MITQLIDPADPVLGFVVRQLQELATRVDRLVVVANEVRTIPNGLDAEVISEDLKIHHAVKLDAGVAPAQVPSAIGEADVLLNATRHGSADKVVFEAMAAGRPVLGTSPAFTPLLKDAPIRLDFPEDDAPELSARMAVLAETSSERHAEIGALLREWVARDHSLGHWADRVADLAGELYRSRNGTPEPEPKDA